MTTTSKYAGLHPDELVALLEKRDGQRKLGLVWERNALAPEAALNDDFVALSLDPSASQGASPYPHLLIEGDNYDVLRYLNIAYRGRVKCIYIDPPYNTGNKDFIYNDDFVDRDDRYRHSTWLEFMYQRLQLARDLLAEDGVIFISISEHEHARLELLCDEVFPGMKVANFVWRTRSGANDEKDWFVSVDHEYVLCYANPAFSFAGHHKALADYANPDNDPRGIWASDNLTAPKNLRQRPNSFFAIQNPGNGVWYPCDPDRVWAFASRERSEGQRLRGQTLEEMIADNRVLWKEEEQPAQYTSEAELMGAIVDGSAPPGLRVYRQLDQLKAQVDAGEAPQRMLDMIPPLSFWVGKNIGYTKPRLKRFASDLKRSDKPLSTWILPSAIKRAEAAELEGRDEVEVMVSGYTSEGTTLLKQMLGHNTFAFPKPLSLIKALVGQATSPQGTDVVLDFFAGSGTTGQAVLELNAEDDGDRRFILVSSTEATQATPERNVCREITAHRLRAAILGYEVPGKSGTRQVEGLGGGFAYLTSERLPLATLHSAVRHDQIWLALQQLHDVGLMPFDAAQEVQLVEGETDRLVYVPQVTEDSWAALQAALGRSERSAIIYSPAPALLSSRLFGEFLSFVAVPEILLERFGGRR